MSNYFIYKLTYTLHKLGFYYYSVKYYIKDNYKKKSNSFIKTLFKALFKEVKIFSSKSLYYEYIEIPITTICTLKCKACSNLIPCYKKPADVDKDILLKSIDVLLKCINNIVYIRVLGGEPFSSKNLIATLDKLIKSDKIQRIEVVTNGTLIPKDKQLIKLLANNRVIVSISKYPNVNIDKLVFTLKKYNINYKIDNMNFWMDYGDTTKKNRTPKELKKQFRKCNHICKSLLNGQLHLCPRSSHGTDLGIITNNENDYLNLLDNTTTINEKRILMSKLFKKKCIVACDYCDFATKNSKKIPVAEQFKK